jgi:hypothetical protein
VTGVSPQDSWEYTWGEACEAITAYNQRENDRARKQAVALYNATAFLTHSLKTMITGGEFKSFGEAFPGFEEQKKSKPREMSDDAMYAVVRALNAQFGGKEDP